MRRATASRPSTRRGELKRGFCDTLLRFCRFCRFCLHQFLTLVKNAAAFPLRPFRLLTTAFWRRHYGPLTSPNGHYHFVNYALSFCKIFSSAFSSLFLPFPNSSFSSFQPLFPLFPNLYFPSSQSFSSAFHIFSFRFLTRLLEYSVFAFMRFMSVCMVGL